MEDKELFRDIIRENVKREGVSELLEWLKSTDFFEAPASTKYHGVCPGGLLRHSLRVCYFMTILPEAAEYSMETRVICGLLHDLCKVGFYRWTICRRDTVHRQRGRSSGERKRGRTRCWRLRGQQRRPARILTAGASMSFTSAQ